MPERWACVGRKRDGSPCLARLGDIAWPDERDPHYRYAERTTPVLTVKCHCCGTLNNFDFAKMQDKMALLRAYA